MGMDDPRVIAVAFAGFLMLLACFVVGMALAFRYKKREMQHRERLAAIEKGTALPAATEPAPWSPRVYLLRGLMWLFSGLGLTVLLLGLAMSPQWDEPAWLRVQQANVARSQGATAAEVQEILGDRHRNGPVPALGLLGLIPMGVGLAYLITYRSERLNR